MQRGFLSQYFEGVAIKRLSAVEVNTSVSNQHEFNGSKALRNLLGNDRRTYTARFLWLSGENEGITAEGWVTWYDARENHPRRSEYRLYFNSNDAMDQAKADDMLLVAKRPNEEIYMIIVPASSTLENQLVWLFGLGEVGFSFNFQPIDDGHDPEVDFAVRYILEEMGIEIDELDTDRLDTVLEPYLNIGFPTTSEFSSLARSTIRDVSPLDNPDDTLLKWMEQEEKLFKRLERHLVARRLRDGFENQEETDVEGFIQFSLSVHNRRKSRVGYALENHLEEIFKAHGITYSRTKVTEYKSKPDFIFPDIGFYHDLDFPTARLTMLGVKSTCKDRWRQVLSEANRIQKKHLLTLEPGISENQTEEMMTSNLQLILPQRLHDTYKPNQRSWLMDLNSFLRHVRDRQ
ncbi:type II restriction endonuclease [Brevibacillus centrosporus]|uniref:type II restriction endonuclease n=1 Tax=Brevibacillus centrosporus TaxID=54910 RepID=UPI003B028698